MISIKGLEQFKTKMNELLPIIRDLNKHYNTNEYQVVEVLVQNLSFKGANCFNYKHSDEVAKCRLIINIISKMWNYNKAPIVGYIYDEVRDSFEVIAMVDAEEGKEYFDK